MGKTVSGAMKCDAVQREVSAYLDATLPASLRRQVSAHLQGCPRCRAAFAGVRNVVDLVGDERAFQLPADVSRRLYSKLERHLEAEHAQASGAVREIPVGITDQRVPLGSHLIYFWENDDEFERGVRFLYPGLGKGEHCILFGHDEALEKALAVLRSHCFHTDELIRSRELTVLRRQASAQRTVSDINDIMQAAVRAGASAVRFLGNLGMGRDPLPAGQDDVIQLESTVSALISTLPSVVVCMYDVRTLPGHLIINGGLRTHHLAVCAEGIRQNPYFDQPHDPARSPRVV
jgi:hypothetical protein